jgi:tetratricopeptide (TPR) repeat protein
MISPIKRKKSNISQNHLEPKNRIAMSSLITAFFLSLFLLFHLRRSHQYRRNSTLRKRESNQLDALGWSNRGNSKISQNRPQEALIDYNKAVELAPNFSDPYLNRGAALLCIRVKIPDFFCEFANCLCLPRKSRGSGALQVSLI